MDKDAEKENRIDRDLEIFKMVEEHFRQDVREFWVRANFYLLAQAGLFSVFFATYPTLIQNYAIVAAGIPTVGLITAIFWFIVLRGAIKWIQLWREQVMKLDKELDRFECYCEVERFAKKKPFLNPSYMTQFLPLVFMIVWAVILIFLLSSIFFADC